jgi:thiol-disulfide isomerase/thioredoxin
MKQTFIILTMFILGISSVYVKGQDVNIDFSFMKANQEVVQVEQKTEKIEEKNKVYFFTASWCGPCQSFKKNELPKLKNISIEIYDIDKNVEFYGKWKKSSKYIPLFVFLDSQGQEYARVTGYQKSSTIIEMLEDK